MKPTPFPSELRTAAFVPRWSIMWKALPDNVAQHSFFVTWYAVMIIETIRWSGPREYVMLKALYHDLEETLTSDITGGVKNEIIDDVKAGPYLEQKMRERMGGIAEMFLRVDGSAEDGLYFEVESIVKAADLLDALLFCIVNKRGGNNGFVKAETILTAKLEAAWRALPAPEPVLSSTWQTVVLPAILAHISTGGQGT